MSWSIRPEWLPCLIRRSHPWVPGAIPAITAAAVEIAEVVVAAGATTAEAAVAVAIAVDPVAAADVIADPRAATTKLFILSNFSSLP